MFQKKWIKFDCFPDILTKYEENMSNFLAFYQTFFYNKTVWKTLQGGCNVEKFFKLKENGTTFSTEVIAGITTFFAMAYIIAVNPNTLSQSGMEWGAVFLATIISSIIGTLIMGLVANVPYAQAPGMGLNAFFVYTVCFALKFTWQQALSMVFICGLINILITVTKVRKYIIKAIPKSLQNAIGGFLGIPDWNCPGGCTQRSES